MPKKLYHWTPDLDTRLRLIYQTSCGRERMIPKLQRMAADLGWPRHTLRLRAQRLGLTKDVARPWSDVELRFLEENAGKMSTREIARVLERTFLSVAGKINRGFFRIEGQLILGEVVELFSVTWYRAKQWVAAGWLTPSAGEWYTIADVHAFMLEHPEAYDPRTVDIEFLRSFIRSTARKLQRRGPQRLAA